VTTIEEFRAAFTEEVGDLSSLTDNDEIDRWVNEGRTRIGSFDEKTDTLSWSAAATSVDLPADCIRFVELVGDDAYTLGGFKVWGKALVPTDPDGASAAGSGTVFYLAYFPAISSGNPSELSLEANRGLLSYALYRFFRKLSSNRLVYKRYATLVGANAVQIEDLQDEASRHYDDFLAAKDEQPLPGPGFFFGDGA
jgi:hypothetical protein